MSFLIFSVTADDEAQYNPPTPPYIHPRVVLDLKSLFNFDFRFLQFVNFSSYSLIVFVQMTPQASQLQFLLF